MRCYYSLMTHNDCGLSLSIVGKLTFNDIDYIDMDFVCH